MNFCKRILDCEKLIRYLYSRSDEMIEHDLTLDPVELHSQSYQNWKLLDKPMSEDKIRKLNISQISNTEPLYDKINNGPSTPNAKRVFNMLMCREECFKFHFTDENTDSPLAVYMTEILGFKIPPKRKEISYLPGRSVTLEMLCEAGSAFNYKKRGIIHGLKALISLEIIEAFEIRICNDRYEVTSIGKENTDNLPLHMYENLLYKLSIDGCINYINKGMNSCAE